MNRREDKCYPTMKPFLLLAFFLLTGWICDAASGDSLYLTGCTWKLRQQVYTNHDLSGTDSNTIKGTSKDYIRFETDGKAYVHYQGNIDTLAYRLAGNQLYMGNQAPYQVKVTSDQTHLDLYQNEEETNGNYNRIRLEFTR